MLDSVHYRVGGQYGYQHVLVVVEGDQPGDTITITDLNGQILITHTRPGTGVKYVGNGRPPGGPGSPGSPGSPGGHPKPDDDNPEPSPMS